MRIKSDKNANSIVLFNALSSLLLQGISFFTAPIISRMLDTSNYGIVAIYITWITVISTAFGLQTQSTIAVSRKDFQGVEQDRYQSSILTLSACSYILLSLCIVLFSNSFSHLLGLQQTIVLVMIVHGFGSMCISFINIKLTYEFKARWNFYLTLCLSVLSLSLSIILIQLFNPEDNYWGRIIGLALPYTILGLCGFCIILFRGKTFFNFRFWKYCLPLCVPIVFHQLSTIVLNQSDRIMIQKMMTDSDVGVYSLACSFAGVLSSIWVALNNSWVPFYYDYMNKGECDEVRAHAKNYLELFTVLACGFVILCEDVYHVFASTQYWEGTNLVYVFAISFYFTFLYSFPVNYEFYNKQTKLIAIGTTGAAIINIIFNYYFIISFGVVGAAFATAMAHALLFIFHQISATTIYKKTSVYILDTKLFIPYLLGFILVLFLAYCLKDFMFLRWLTAIAIAVFEIIRIYKRKSIF